MIQLFHLSPRSKNDPLAGIMPRTLDHSHNSRPDWGTCWLIREVLRKQPLEEDEFFGFFPADFSERTGISAEEIYAFSRHAASEGNQAILFDPNPEETSRWKNVFDQIGASDPYFPTLSQQFIDSAKIPIQLDQLFMDSRQIALEYCLVATWGFWRTWMSLTEQLVRICELGSNPLRLELNTAPGGTKSYSRKVLLAERLVPLIFAGQKHWRVKAYNPYSTISFRKLPAEIRGHAIICDALKRAIRDQGPAGYLEALSALNARHSDLLNSLESERCNLNRPQASAEINSTPNYSRIRPEPIPLATTTHQVSNGSVKSNPAPKDLASLSKFCEKAIAKGEVSVAVFQFEQWLSAKANQHNATGWLNFSSLLGRIGRYDAAENASRRAIELKPDLVGAHLNRFMALEQMGRPEEAVAALKATLALPTMNQKRVLPQRASMLNQLARVQDDMRDFGGAESSLMESLLIDANQPGALSTLVRLRQKQCKWPVFSAFGSVTTASMQKAATPLFTLGFFDDPEIQLKAAQRKIKELVPKLHRRLIPAAHRYGHRKLRIAYVSGDLRAHAVGLLTVEMLELHDRSQFEVYAFCWNRSDGTEIESRIRAAIDHFEAVDELSDEEVAKRILSQEIDVAVDLQGLTNGARPGILARGAAPIQISFLGFPGTCAIPYVDYIVADDYVYPKELEGAMSEKPLRVQGCFQPSDRKRQVGLVPNRSQASLPDDAFVFCALNNNYKITPQTFESWLRVLKRCEGSVLWLLADNASSKKNLLAAADLAGINKERLVFASRVSPPDYLARFALGDVFLDTYPYNAGTTANDALWMGLPILTVSGRTYISRMAGSLMKSVGLEYFICDTQIDQEEKAIHLFNNRHVIHEAKSHLKELKSRGELFDTEKYTKAFETELLKLCGQS